MMKCPCIQSWKFPQWVTLWLRRYKQIPGNILPTGLNHYNTTCTLLWGQSSGVYWSGLPLWTAPLTRLSVEPSAPPLWDQRFINGCKNSGPKIRVFSSQMLPRLLLPDAHPNFLCQRVPFSKILSTIENVRGVFILIFSLFWGPICYKKFNLNMSWLL